jgi:S-adenosylmethionine:diacylglycerol 3-amino-3-carboxypropyl transferase
VGRFLQLDDIAEQTRFWREHLDTARFRAAVDGLLSLTALRRLYATRFLDFLPPRLGAVMRARLARGFAAHPNRSNPFARSLLLGELAPPMPPIRSAQIRFERADAASFLERQPHGSFDGFALSNILDGDGESYAHRLHAAVRRAATPRATVVQRSFREPRANDPNNRAGDDRSMLWGIVDVRRAAQHS